jgi:hypothetical protein
MKTKNTHGGKRAGAGVKPKYGEPTIYVPVKIPASLVKLLDKTGNRSETIIKALKQYFNV